MARVTDLRSEANRGELRRGKTEQRSGGQTENWFENIEASCNQPVRWTQVQSWGAWWARSSQSRQTSTAERRERGGSCSSTCNRTSGGISSFMFGSDSMFLSSAVTNLVLSTIWLSGAQTVKCRKKTKDAPLPRFCPDQRSSAAECVDEMWLEWRPLCLILAWGKRS